MKFNLLKKQQKIQKKKEKSRGRSMVEMLGVLAIIGVLSIGGIQGYTIAMRKYRGNEIAHLLVKYANLVYTDFYNYMVLHPDDVKIDNYGSYTCKYRSCYHSDSFLNKGLGGYPKGINNIQTHYIFPESEDFPFPRVSVHILFDDHKLCKRVADSLSMFVSDGADIDSVSDGVFCDSRNSITKNITIEGFNDEAISRAKSYDSSYSNDNYW